MEATDFPLVRRVEGSDKIGRVCFTRTGRCVERNGVCVLSASVDPTEAATG